MNYLLTNIKMNALKNPTIRRRTLRNKYEVEMGTSDECDCCDCATSWNKYGNVPVDYDRIRALAAPKYRERKFQTTPDEQQIIPNRHFTIEREPYMCERIRQLALPRVRYLTSTKEQFRPVIGEDRAKVLNMNIQKSLHTLYSRIANIPVPQKSCVEKPLINWQLHKKWLETRALPKSVYEPVEEKQKSHPKRPINQHLIDHLAQPKRRTHKNLPTHNPFAVKSPALTYEITPEIAKLAAPIVRPPETPLPPYERPYPLASKLDRIKSAGIKKLCIPTRPRKFFARGDNASIVFTVSKAACKHVASRRTMVICKPKRMFGAEPKKDPFKVAPKALTAKQSPKIIEFYKRLSTPRKPDKTT